MLCYRVKMLPTGHAVYVDASFSQDGISPARGVFLSPYSRARCNIPSILAMAHTTMTLLLVAPLRLSRKDKRKENIPLQESALKTSVFGNELRQATFCVLRAIAASLQIMRGTKKSMHSAKLKGGIRRAARSSSSNSPHPHPLRSPLALQPSCRTLHPGDDALGHRKTSHFPVKACSETS